MGGARRLAISTPFAATIRFPCTASVCRSEAPRDRCGCISSRVRDLVANARAWPCLGASCLERRSVAQYLADLLPLPMTEEALDVVCRNVDQVQNVLGRHSDRESSSYLQFSHSTIPEWEFISAVASTHRLRNPLRREQYLCQRCNHGWDASAYLAALPQDAIGEIHLAGHRRQRDCRTHAPHRRSRLASDPGGLGALPRSAGAFGPVPTLIEWDTDVPPLDLCSMKRPGRGTPLNTCGRSRGRCPRCLIPSGRCPGLHRARESTRPRRRTSPAAGSTAAERLDVYRNTFLSSLTTALRISYPAVHRLVGGEFFEGAAQSFIQAPAAARRLSKQ